MTGCKVPNLFKGSRLKEEVLKSVKSCVEAEGLGMSAQKSKEIVKSCETTATRKGGEIRARMKRTGREQGETEIA